MVTWRNVLLVDDPDNPRHKEQFQVVYDFVAEAWTINLGDVKTGEDTFIGWLEGSKVQNIPVEPFTYIKEKAYLLGVNHMEVDPPVQPEPPVTPPVEPEPPVQPPVTPPETGEWEILYHGGDVNYEYELRRREK